MSYRLSVPDTAFRSTPAKAKPKRSRAYLEWLHELPCAITGASPVDAAHLSAASPFYGHFGRGKGQKADDRWILPLSPEMHRDQHAGSEMAFWTRHGINPHRLALVLHALWEQGVSADYAATVMRLHKGG